MQGKLIGDRYRILDRLGEGGMAVVYIARDEKLGRKVAIKILHQHFAENEDVRARFAMEATAISTMDHPNILNVYDFSGPNSSQLWIVTELLNGQTLSQFAKSFSNSCVNPIVSCFIVREILKALDHAHGKDIVHRDIKPDNVMVQKNGRIILMDFGIAKNMHKSSMTMTGTFMGSPSYMSPEQIRGKDVDARSDVYSLGVLFYEIITGRLPYTGDSTHAVIMKIMEGKFSAPRFIVPGLPQEVDHVICHAMRKTAKNRFQNSHSFAEQIDLFIQKIGFVESHVELERYASNPSKYMALLVKMTQQSLRSGTIKTAHLKTTKKNQYQDRTVAQKNQTSILKPVEFNADRTRIEKKAVAAAPRRDRVVPTKMPSKKNTTVHVDAKAQRTKMPGQKVAKVPTPKKRRVRPAIPKRAKPVAAKQRMSQRVVRQPDNPLLGMAILAVIFVVLGWGFYELVIKTYKPSSIERRQSPPSRVVKKRPKIEKRIQPQPKRPRQQKKVVKQARKVETPTPTPRRQIERPVKRRNEKVTNTRTTQAKQELKSPHQLEKQRSEPVMPAPVAAGKKREQQRQAQEEAKRQQTTSKGVIIISANTAARIFIDGRAYGTTVDDTYHSRPIEVEAGRRKITLKHSAYEDLTLYRNVKSGEKLYVDDLQLKKKAIKVVLSVNVNKFPTKMTLKGRNNDVFVRRDILRANERILLEPGPYTLRVQYEDKVIEREVNLLENKGGFTINLDFTRN